jgi:hypothetical protein
VVKEAALRGETVLSYIKAVDVDYDHRLSSRLPTEVLSD